MQSYFIASDHAGLEAKACLCAHLTKLGRQVTDLGPFAQKSVDYPDYAHRLAMSLKQNPQARGVLICGSGIGMSIAANRHEHIRAALCRTVEDAKLSRQHNNANVLVLGARTNILEDLTMITTTFDQTQYEGGRHDARLAKLSRNGQSLAVADPEIYKAIEDEARRQQESLELIASENIVSQAVLEAQGSIMTNKYAEGYPGKRYYGGCEFVDVAENIAIERLKQLYQVNFANVQPHSGSQANQAVFAALLQPGDTILGMSLDSGGHLTHGSKVNLSGKWFDAVHYNVRQSDGLIDYDDVARLALEHRPRLIIAGGSAYPRTIDFARFRKIADEVGAYLLVDMAHFSGLVAGGVFPSPVEHAHVVTSTTHKTLRGPRGGIILTNDEDLAKKFNSAIFPGIQGGPLMHVIAAKAVAFGEALQPSFKEYAARVIANAQTLAATLINRGYSIFTGGTDCHLMLVDLRPQGLKGLHAEKSLERAGLTCNKNSIPFDTEKPFITSGIRLGSPALTTRGLEQNDFIMVGDLIANILDALDGEGNIADEVIQLNRQKVLELCAKYPI